MEKIKELLSDDAFRLYLINLLTYIGIGVFSAIAVGTDAKLCHIKHRKFWTIIAFLFAYVGLAVYFSLRKWLKQKVPIVCRKCGKKAPKNSKVCPKCGGTSFGPLQIENRSAMATKTAICIFVAIAISGVSYWATNYSPLAINLENSYEETYFDDAEYEDYNADEVNEIHYAYKTATGVFVYYDRFGNPYELAEEVPFYDKDGKEYFYEIQEGFDMKDPDGNITPQNCCLVDSDGYFVDAQKEFGNVPTNVPFVTKDGKKYYYAKSVSWDEDGNLVYSSNGNPVN